MFPCAASLTCFGFSRKQYNTHAVQGKHVVAYLLRFLQSYRRFRKFQMTMNDHAEVSNPEKKSWHFQRKDYKQNCSHPMPACFSILIINS